MAPRSHTVAPMARFVDSSMFAMADPTANQMGRNWKPPRGSVAERGLPQVTGVPRRLRRVGAEEVCRPPNRTSAGADDRLRIMSPCGRNRIASFRGPIAPSVSRPCVEPTTVLHDLSMHGPPRAFPTNLKTRAVSTGPACALLMMGSDLHRKQLS